MNKKIKWFSCTGSNGGHWIEDGKQVNNYEDCDMIIMEGGNDWPTSWYNQKSNSFTYGGGYQRDHIERDYFRRAVQDGKMIFGICKGMQGICIFANSNIWSIMEDMKYI